jgi:hypothetical protein
MRAAMGRDQSSAIGFFRRAIPDVVTPANLHEILVANLRRAGRSSDFNSARSLLANTYQPDMFNQR